MTKYIGSAIILTLAFAGELLAEEANELTHILDCATVTYDLAFEKVNDLTFDATMYEKRLDGDGNIEETKKYEKKISLKKGEAGRYRYHEEYLGYYVDGEKKEKEDLKKLAKDREERKKRRGGRDISFDIAAPLKPANRELFEIRNEGVAEEPYSGLDCYRLSARPVLEKFDGDAADTLVNYLFYIDTASFHIARVDFEPASLASQFMFKMKELKMSIRYEPYDDQLWLPARFEIEGKGKAMYFIGIDFKAEELYSNPVVNGGVSDTLFK